MSIMTKLLATTILVGGGVIAGGAALQQQGYAPANSSLFAPLVSLAGSVGITASAPAAVAGPLDKTFNAKRVHLDKVSAQIDLVTTPTGPMRVQASGKPETMKELQVRVVGDELYIRLDKHEDEAWFPWNIFNMWAAERKPIDLRLRVSAPTGTPYELESVSGSVTAGDLDAPVSLDGHSLNARFGKVLSADVSLAGSGRVTFGPIRDKVDIEIAGSARFEAPSASSAQVEIAGAGEVRLGTIAQGLDIEVAGSGDVAAASINGPLDISIAGSGDVAIEAGTATSFETEIAGSGDVVFKGHAMNPKISIAGSGSVTVGSYSGDLDKDVMGSGDFIVLSKGPVAPPPAPPAPPAH